MADLSPNKKAHPADKRILVIDDDDAILMMLKSAFEIEGFQVRTARDGRDILKKAGEYHPHLIISDLMMPGGGGYEVLRALQSDPITRQTPVLLITGSNMAPSTKEMMKQEPNLAGYYEKPIRPETLLGKVHKLLNTLSPAEERAAQAAKEDWPGFNERF